MVQWEKEENEDWQKEPGQGTLYVHVCIQDYEIINKFLRINDNVSVSEIYLANVSPLAVALTFLWASSLFSFSLSSGLG